ncbi:MAG TPA: hypothetical protein VLZ77_04825 [Acidimicrobiales bacterium]|nr:hypothetical protein [Acidimicrobiales bacterium]
MAFFAPAGRAFVFVSAGQPVPFTEVLSYAQTCGSDTNARSDFDDLRRVAQSVSGIGDEALIASFTNKNERNVQVVWRKGQVLGSVMVQGPPHNVRITPTAVTRLAKRAAGGA